MATRWWQEGGETQEYGFQMQSESNVWRKIRVHIASGTAEGSCVGSNGHGFWQYWS